jgi:hypothetical protein
MSDKFTGPIVGVIVPAPAPHRPTPEQIAATGAALPEGAHRLTEAQQRAWFGGVVFDGPVVWEEGRGFVSGGAAFTPQQVAEAALTGRRLGRSGGAQ